MGEREMIAGFQHRWQVEAQLGALERELRGHIRDERHRASIETQIEIFAAELERMDREGDFEEPKRLATKGRLRLGGRVGRPSDQMTRKPRAAAHSPRGRRTGYGCVGERLGFPCALSHEGKRGGLTDAEGSAT